MRLIDADKADMPIMQRKDGEWVFRCDLKEILDTLPTIEAIPIEWIVKYCNKGNLHYCDIDLMLEAWEAENEIV